MFQQYGSYQHAAGECEVSISRNTQFSDDGVPMTRLDRWDTSGVLYAADSTALMAAIASMQSAYSTHGLDLYLKYDDGTILHHLRTADTLGGTRVVMQPSFPVGRGPEGGTYRTYTLAVEGEIFLADPGVTQWQETLSWSGGGPLYVFMQALNGPPQKQLAAQQTPYMCQQSGSAVGYNGWPTIPPPIFYSELIANPVITRGTPRRRGRVGPRQFVEYPVSWSYQYKSASPFPTVSPTLPP